jgi:hypothetical protein
LPIAYCLLPIAFPNAFYLLLFDSNLLLIAYSLLPITHCLLPIAYCLLPIAFPNAFYLLLFDSKLLLIAYSLLPITHCLLPIAYCLLPSTYYLLSIPNCQLLITNYKLLILKPNFTIFQAFHSQGNS